MPLEARSWQEPPRGADWLPRLEDAVIMAKTRIRTSQFQPAEAARGARPAAPNVDAAHCPIEMLYEEHFHQRQMAQDMEALADSQMPRPDLARCILGALTGRLIHHRADEDESLFPRLRTRAHPEDEIGPLLDQLQAEHAQLRDMSDKLMPALYRMADGALPAPEDRDALHRFAQAERNHLIAENALVLPLARLRLSASDKLAALAEMRARRSQPPAGPPIPPDAEGKAE